MSNKCLCVRCTDGRRFNGVGNLDDWRYACEICGNKRCPHHADHRNACTNSNEPGQVGIFSQPKETTMSELTPSSPSELAPALPPDALTRPGFGFSQAQLLVDPILQFFQYSHLPPHLQEASWPFAQLAEHIVMRLPRNAERTAALRKLLEAKDCAVRAMLG